MALSKHNLPRYRYMTGQDQDGRPLGSDSPITSDKVFKSGKKWEPERREIHKKIVRDIQQEFASIPKGKKALILAGEPGSGKSTVVNGIGGFEGNYVVVDTDDIRDKLLTSLKEKGLLPVVEHPLAHDITPRELSSLFHEEASHIAKRVETWALNTGRNILLDKTLASASSQNAIREIKQRGYLTTGVYVHCSPEKSAAQRKKRYVTDINANPELGGRFVPENVVQDSLQNTPKNFNAIRNEGLFDRSFSVSTDGPKPVIQKAWNQRAVVSQPPLIAEINLSGKKVAKTLAKPRAGIGSRTPVSQTKSVSRKRDVIPVFTKAKPTELSVNPHVAEGKARSGVNSSRLPNRKLVPGSSAKRTKSGVIVKKKIGTPQPLDLRIQQPKKVSATGEATSKKPSTTKALPTKRFEPRGTRNGSKRGISVLKPGSRPVAKKTGAALGQTRPVSKAVAKPIDGSKQQTAGQSRPVPTVKKATAVQKSVAQQPQPTVRMLPNAPARSVPTPRGTTKRGIRKTTLPPLGQTNPQQRRPRPTVTSNSQNRKPPINGERNSFVPNSNVPAPVRQTPDQTTTKKVRSRKIKALNMIGKSRPVVQGQNGNIQTVKKQVRAKTNQPKPSVKKQIVQKAVGKKSPPKPTNNVPQTTRVQSRKNVAAPQPTVKKAPLLATKKAPTPKPTAAPQPTVKPKPIVAPIPPAKKPIQPPQPPRPGGR